jgi:hypothetical protein
MKFRDKYAIWIYIPFMKSDFSVTVQDIDRTNALLKKNIFWKNDELTSDELAKILGVDAVIKCSYAYTKNSEVVKLLWNHFWLVLARCLRVN